MEPSSDPDEGLAAVWIARIAAGDRQAFELLYRAYERRIFGFVFRLAGADLAADAFADVMIDVWSKAGRFRPSGKASTWLFAIAHNKSVDALRRRDRYARRAGARALHAAPDPERGPESAAIEDESARALRAALAELSADQRAVIELAFLRGFAQAEIAQIVGCPLNTVKTRTFYARRRLREILESQGYGREAI